MNIASSITLCLNLPLRNPPSFFFLDSIRNPVVSMSAAESSEPRTCSVETDLGVALQEKTGRTMNGAKCVATLVLH